MAGSSTGNVPGPKGNEGGPRPELHREESDQFQFRVGQKTEEQSGYNSCRWHPIYYH